MTDPMDKGSDTCQMKDYRHMQEEPKIDKMRKLQKEVEFIDVIQRVRTNFLKNCSKTQL